MTFIPDHTDVEIEEPVEAPQMPHEHPEAGVPTDPLHPSVHDIVVGCLAQALPCPVCGRTDPCRCVRPVDYSPTEARATLIEKALIHFGHLPDPGVGEAAFDPEETARWLADRSGHPRYVQVEDGWRRLIESENDVELASIHATRRVSGSEVETVKAAKSALLGWHQARH